MIKRVNLKKTARAIITANQYMTLGTVNDGKRAWVSPVAYAFDKNYNLYFVSLPDSQHGKNIKRDAKLSVAIFDSHQLFGEGVGLQISGEARIVPIRASVSVFRCYFGRKWPYGDPSIVKGFKKLFKMYKYRFYRVRPTEVWLNDPRQEYDTRVRVRL